MRETKTNKIDSTEKIVEAEIDLELASELLNSETTQVIGSSLNI